MIKSSPSKYVERMSNLITLASVSGEIDNIPSQMLWGQPGIGKSASIYDLAKNVQQMLATRGKKVFVAVTDIRLILFNPVDLRGIPTANDDKTESVWLRPHIFKLKEKTWVNPNTGEECELSKQQFRYELVPDAQTGKMKMIKHVPPISDDYKVISEVVKGDKVEITIAPKNAELWDVINFFFMDEISAAAPSVQACAYQITHDKQLGEHKLPKNTIVFCAGNRVTDKSVAYAMPMALTNRVTHTEYTLDHDGWREWALDKGIDQKIISFLGFQKQCLNKFVDSNGKVTTDQVFPTPRSWENASNYLKLLDINDAYPFIAGTIGEGTATEFRSYCNVYGRLPNIDDILAGKPVQQFTEADISYAIVTSLYISLSSLDATNPQTKDKLANALKYILGMKSEYAILCGRDLLRIRPLLPTLLRLPEWQTWKTKYSRYLD